MTSYQFRQESVVVATARSASQAELLQMTFAAHGITAMVVAPSVYPSVDFVEGVRVTVMAEDEERARELLEALGYSDDAPEGEGEDEP